MRTFETKVYQFSELSDTAKEQARDWYRGLIDSDDFESVIEDATRVAELLGINLRTRPVKLMGGGTRYDPCIWWSGFYSQGDGACFEGTYSYAKASKLKEYAPKDTELQRIADGLQAIQRINFYALSASMSHAGHYNHSGCMAVDVERTDDRTMVGDAEAVVTQLMRDFADWIYHQLDKENDYLNSEENVDEAIEANEYEFEENGNRA